MDFSLSSPASRRAPGFGVLARGLRPGRADDRVGHIARLALPFMAKLRGMKPLPIKTSAFTLIGITGEVAAGKLAVTFDSGTLMTMYVALLKPKTGWTIVEIVTDKDLLRSIFPRPPKRTQ